MLNTAKGNSAKSWYDLVLWKPFKQTAKTKQLRAKREDNGKKKDKQTKENNKKAHSNILCP